MRKIPILISILLVVVGCTSMLKIGSSVAIGAETTTLAILNFINPQNKPELLEWGKRYAEFLTVELSKDKRLILVERNEIDRILKELETTLSGLEAKDRAIQIGKLLGAQIMAIGKLEAKEGIIQIRVDLVQPSTGNVLGAERLESKEKELLAYQGILLEKFKKALNIAFTKIESQKKRRTVAVLQFKNTSQFERLDYLGKELQYVLMTDLSKDDEFIVLERKYIEKIINEIRLSKMGLVEDATLQKALGADIIVGGEYSEELESGEDISKSVLKVAIQVRYQDSGEVKTGAVAGGLKQIDSLKKKVCSKFRHVMKLDTAKVDRAHRTQIRLAIIDVGQAKPVPSAFIDLLFIELSRHLEIALLEREEIALILKEQALNLSFAGDLDPKAIVKSGQILAADVILMLKNEGDSEIKIDLRLRLVDTRHGLKLLDSNQTIESKPGGYEEKAQLIVASMLQHIKRMNVDPGQLLLVGVSTFKSEEMAKCWDWLSDVIPANIEQNLALYPGVSLMERTVVKPFIDEREFSSDLPESIAASAILLDGAYRIDRTKDAISLFIRARRDRQTVLETTIEGPLNEIEQLCGKAAKIVLEKVRPGPAKKPMDPAIEAEMLAAEARTYLSRQEYSRALLPAESAYALMPQSLEYPELIIRALIEGELSEQAMGGEEQARLAKSRFRVLNLAERIIRTCALPSDKNLAQELDQDLAYLHMHFYAMEEGFTVMTYGCSKMKEDNRYKDLYAEFSHNFWRLFEVCHNRYAGKCDRLHKRLLYQGSWALNLIQDVDETVRMANKILTDQVKLNVDLYGIRGFLNAVRLKWQDDDEALKKAGDFLASLQESSNPKVRLEALEYGIQFYSGISLNHEKVRSLGKEYAEFCKIACNPNPNPVANQLFFPDEKASEIFESELLADIIDFSIENHLVRTNANDWSSSTVRLADLLEKQGQPTDAIAYLRRMSNEFDNSRTWRWHELQDKINEIQERYPEIEIADASSASDQFKPVLIFSVTDKILSNRKVKDIRFRRLVVDDDENIIVFSPRHDNRYGVIRLDRRDAHLLAIQSLEAVKELKSRWVNDYWEYNRGPAVTVHKGDVYLGFMHAGFLVFGRDGTTMRLNEENGLTYNNIRHLECLGDKIFAHVGAPRRDSGLMELDLKTSHSKIITSTRVGKVKYELDHRAIGGIAPDPGRGVLWVLSENQVYTGYGWNRLYRYNATSGDFQRVSTKELDKFLQETSTCSDKPNRLHICGDFLLIYNGRGLCEFNLTSQQATTLIYNYCDAKWKFPWYIYPTITFALVEGGLVCVESNQLLYFQERKKEPNYISKELFGKLKSDKLEVREMVPSAEGLYVLTPNALYLIPEIKSWNSKHDN